MKKMMFFGAFAPVLSVAALGCNGGSSSSPAPTQTSVSPAQFVSAVVSAAQDGTVPQGYAGTTLAKNPTLVQGTFIIYSSETKQYEAITLAYAEDSGLTAQQMVQQFVAEDQYLSGLGAWQNGDVNPVLVAPDQQQPGLYIGSTGTLYSNPQETKDTELQQAQVQQTSYLQRAANVSAHYQMSFTSAAQLTALADKINAATAQQLTAADLQAVSNAILKIAGLSSDQVTQAVSASAGGSDTLANSLVTQVAQNLGMPSDAMLRDEILPSLGVTLSVQ